jgi:uncharacterized protein (TIGR00255 family)
MTASMTAFGRLEHSSDWGSASWEIRTVNHRYLEMSVRLPEDLRVLEPAIREHISARIKRGKVDCQLRLDQGEEGITELPINQKLAQTVINAASALSIPNPAPLNPVDVLRWPGVIEKQGLDSDRISGPLLDLLDDTLALLVETREREGTKMKAMILERCEAAAAQVQKMRDRLPEIMASVRERYLSRAQEAQLELDKERLEQEMLLLAQKMDVAEELDRMDAHIQEIQRVLAQNEPKGRRLDFLMQEMNREANTLGSKAIHIDTSNASVELKVLIEQMREQIQNIE